MRSFIYKLLLFSLPIVVLLLPLDYFLSSLYRKAHSCEGELEVLNDIYNGKAKCNFAIYGSSRAFVHIDPKVVKDSLNVTAYNFGNDGHNFWLQYMRHLDFIKFNAQPKTILYAVDVFTLQKRKDLYNLNQFLPFMLWNNTIREYASSYEGFKTFDFLIPLVRYAGKGDVLKEAITIFLNKDHTPQCRQRGYRAIDRVWSDELEKAKSKNEKYEAVLDTPSIKLFEQFIQECKQSHINLILVYTPEYIEGQNYISNRKEIVERYITISQKNNLSFYDYSNDSMVNNKSLFYNSMHLNRTGSQMFSKKLAHDLKLNERFE
jgi:hypothetical protein